MSSPVIAGASAASGPARERVYEWLRDEIIRGSLEGGRFLDEQWVSGTVGVSRTPVREAFHRLAAERFITLLPRKGAQVRMVTGRELEEVYQTRMLIEGHAVQVICQRELGAPEQMSELIEPMEAAAAERDPQRDRDVPRRQDGCAGSPLPRARAHGPRAPVPLARQ